MTYRGLPQLLFLAGVGALLLAGACASAQEEPQRQGQSSSQPAGPSSPPVPSFGPVGPDSAADKRPSADSEQTRGSAPNRHPVEAEGRLVQRAQQRWAALIDRDFAAAYEYATPSFREIYGAGDFALRYGRDVTWLGAEVVRIEPRSPTSAAVHVRVDYQIVEKPTMRDLKMHSIVEEPWIRVNDDWWFVPKS